MPGWDTFLTEQDKAHQEVRGKRSSTASARTPCVLVIDDYYSVLGLEREPILESIKTWPMSCGLEGWEAIDKTVELLASAARANIPVIYVHGLEGFPSPVVRRKPCEARATAWQAARGDAAARRTRSSTKSSRSRATS